MDNVFCATRAACLRSCSVTSLRFAERPLTFDGSPRWVSVPDVLRQRFGRPRGAAGHAQRVLDHQGSMFAMLGCRVSPIRGTARRLLAALLIVVAFPTCPPIEAAVAAIYSQPVLGHRGYMLAQLECYISAVRGAAADFRWQLPYCFAFPVLPDPGLGDQGSSKPWTTCSRPRGRHACAVAVLHLYDSWIGRRL